MDIRVKEYSRLEITDRAGDFSARYIVRTCTKYTRGSTQKARTGTFLTSGYLPLSRIVWSN